MDRDNNKELARKAREIYHERLKSVLEASFYGQFVAIEIDSGDYFLGSSPLEAIKKGKQRYPNKVFHVMKVGFKAALILKKGVFDGRQNRRLR